MRIWDFPHKLIAEIPGMVGIMRQLKFSFPFPKFPGIVGKGIPINSNSRHISVPKKMLFKMVILNKWLLVDFLGIHEIPKQNAPSKVLG